MEDKAKYRLATFAGGCFWCMQPAFQLLDGVKQAVVGYTGGRTSDPTYEEVSAGRTGHLESVQVTYDPDIVSYRKLLDTFWQQIDPTDPDGSFFDRGHEYTSAIFYHDAEQKAQAERSKEEIDRSGRFEKPIVTRILPAKRFYPAEEYHQDYKKKNPVSYAAYRIGSGRDRFIKKHWKGYQSD